MFTGFSGRKLVAALVCGLLPLSAAATERDLDVQIHIVEGEIQSQAVLFVRASPQRVWEVITDYERAPEFTRDLKVSRIVARTGNTMRVLQRSQVRFGPFTVPVETVREVRLLAPTRVEGRLVGGASLRKYDSITELVPFGGGTRIVYRSQAIPESALASLAGESFVKRETESRFRDLRAEILRREHVAEARTLSSATH